MRTTLPFWAWCAVAVVCAGLYTVSVPVLSAVYHVHLALALAVATVQCGSLVVAIFRPALGTGLHLLAVAATALATRAEGDPWPLPVTGLVSLGALVLLLGIRERWVVSLAAWWSSVVVLVVLIVATPDRYAVPDQWGTNLTIYASYSVLVLAVGIALGQRRRIRADLAEARRDVELEHAQRRYAEERARIAREMHDVVAHSMSLVHMQAQSAPYRLTRATKTEVDGEFESIARSARAALAEMRQLLGTLGSGDAELVPQPQLGDIQELADATVRAGVPVRVELDPAAGTVSPIVQLTAYRIVQEALSNVMRHAPGAATDVVVRGEGASTRVLVRNDRPRGPAAGLDRGGHGLRGMRERVGLLGGEFSAGPTADGGFLVTATLPVAVDQHPESR